MAKEPGLSNDPQSSSEPRPILPALRFLYGIVQRQRRAVMLLVYAGVTALAYLSAYVLRFDFEVPDAYWTAFAVTLPLLVAIRLVASRVFRLTTGRWRFVGTEDLVRLVGATLAGTAVFWLLVGAVPFLPVIPRSILLLEWVLATAGTGGAWLSYRVAFERLRRRGAASTNGGIKRALVVGAGEAGNMLAREILRYPTGYRLVGFVDDDPFKWGTTLHGVEVVGATADLRPIARATGAEEIIIAVPSATPAQLRRIVEQCQSLDAPFKTLPGMEEVFEGEVRLGQLRPLRIEDLLGREPVTLELPELREDLEGRSVMITGGAGSIGSELARQIAVNRPARLVLLDQAESELYFVQRELSEAHPDLALTCVVGDILDEACLRRLFREHAPERVFHAAAYKHVPLMEENVRAAVRNNVLGTWRVAQVAAESGTEKFVLISTDKAVEPRSAMGATKRAAEQIVMACRARYNGASAGTSFVAVRFGNVLGSNGSVIPIFRRQLEAGRPLTVTHPDVTRYFMTISEAVQLVLQASNLDEAQGRITMLEMGEPIRILDLARNMIRVSGLREGIDAHIEFTGLRPGEKLHEVLTGSTETASRTSVDKVWLVEGSGEGEAYGFPWESVDDAAAALERIETEALQASFLARFMETGTIDGDFVREAPAFHVREREGGRRPWLVTGAAGFIGFHTARRLLQEGEWVVGIDNLNAYYDPALKNARLALLREEEGFEFRRLDLTDRAGIEALFREGAGGRPFGTVLHLAAQAGVRHSLPHPHAYVDTNVKGTLHVLEGCRHHDAEHLVFASTSSVYGANRRIPFSEGHPTSHPLSIYAATKRANEGMAHSYAHLYGLPCTGLRFFTVYGPWGRPDMALFKFTKAILAGEPIDVYGHGKPARDFTYVDDIVEGILRAATTPPTRSPEWDPEGADPGTSAAPYRLLNIGAKRKVNLMHFIETLERCLGVEAKKNMLPMQPGDVLESHANTERIGTLAGYEPEVGVEDGVRRFVEWYLEFYGEDVRIMADSRAGVSRPGEPR